MKRLLNLYRFLVLVVILLATIARADDLIPKAARQVPRGFGATVSHEWPEKGPWVWKSLETGEPSLHMRQRVAPHDLGIPEGDPFFAVNEPGRQDTNEWKDLNSKFVFMVYRDYVLTGRKDIGFLREIWPSGDLESEWQFSRLHIYATSRDLGDANRQRQRELNIEVP